MTNERVLTRRDFVRLGASAATALTVGGWPLPAWSAGPRKWGLQLYTLRNQMRDKPGETLKAVAAIGYREIEVLQQSLERDMPFVKAAGLEAPSMHMPAAVVTGDWTVAREAAKRSGGPAPNESYGIEAAIADAKRHGIRHVVVAFIPQEDRTLDFYQRFPDALNRAGEKCRAAGLRLAYHNHAFEFETVGGLVPMTFMLERFDASLVTLEMDVFWWSLAGRDPVEDIKKLGKKVTLLHLKDRAKGTENAAPDKQVPAAAFAEVGSGTLDFKAILSAAGHAGVEHVFVEQDQTPGDPLDSIKKSYTYLSTLKL
jgi:sugar phosphate isomerase/epimerase